jgi:hypothetical protein
MPWHCTTIIRSVRIADDDIRYSDIDDLWMSPPKAWDAPMAMAVVVKAIANATTITATRASVTAIANATVIGQAC